VTTLQFEPCSRNPVFGLPRTRNLFESADFSERKAAQQHKNRVSSRPRFLFKVQSRAGGIKRGEVLPRPFFNGKGKLQAGDIADARHQRGSCQNAINAVQPLRCCTKRAITQSRLPTSPCPWPASPHLPYFRRVLPSRGNARYSFILTHKPTARLRFLAENLSPFSFIRTQDGALWIRAMLKTQRQFRVTGCQACRRSLAQVR